MTDHRRVLREMLQQLNAYLVDQEPEPTITLKTAWLRSLHKNACAALDRFANVDDDAALFRTEPDGRVTVVHCVPERDYLCTGELLISIATEANQWLEDRARLRAQIGEAIRQKLRDYRCAFTFDEDCEGGAALVDVLTPTTAGSIEDGIREREFLAECLESAVLALLTEGAQPRPVEAPVTVEDKLRWYGLYSVPTVDARSKGEGREI